MAQKSLLRKLWENRWVLRSLPYTLYFNFYYLPLAQAVKLPIWLYKPRLLACQGRVVIDPSTKISPGMIKLGNNIVSIYPNNGITWEHRGIMYFKGRASIGNSSYISTGKDSEITFGPRFHATASFRLVSYYKISFGQSCTIGWDCIIMDTDLHALTRIDGSKSKGYGMITIGNHNWIANNCSLLKNVRTPDYLVVAANTVLTKSYQNIPAYSVIGSSHEVKVLGQGWLDTENDSITL